MVFRSLLVLLKMAQMTSVGRKMKHVSASVDIGPLFVTARLWKAIYQLFIETLVLIYAYTKFGAPSYLRPHSDRGFVAVYSEHRESKLFSTL